MNLPPGPHASVGFGYKIVSKTWRGDYHGYGAFCTLRCCEQFANLVYKSTKYRRGAKP